MSALRLRGRAIVGLPIVAVFAVLAVVGPSIAPYAPTAIDLAHNLEGPSRTHWLGTGDNGVDLLSVILAGARLAGTVSFSSVFFSSLVGITLGGGAAFVGGKIDAAVARVTDAVQSFPSLIVNMAVLALAERPGVSHLIVALSVTGWVGYARLARAEVLRLREREFVLAARALGATPTRVFFKHVLPNASGPLWVQATFGLGGAVLAEAALSYLGLGPGARASWGALLDQGTTHLLQTPRLAVCAGMAITTTVLGLNLSGDWLRDKLDPRNSAD